MAGRGGTKLNWAERGFDRAFPNQVIRIHYANEFAGYTPPDNNDNDSYPEADRFITTALAAAFATCRFPRLELKLRHIIPPQTRREEYRYEVLRLLINWNIKRIKIIDENLERVMVIGINHKVIKGKLDPDRLVAPPEESEAGILQIIRLMKERWGGRPEFADWVDDPLFQRITLSEPPEFQGTTLMLPTNRKAKENWFRTLEI